MAANNNNEKIKRSIFKSSDEINKWGHQNVEPGSELATSESCSEKLMLTKKEEKNILLTCVLDWLEQS